MPLEKQILNNKIYKVSNFFTKNNASDFDLNVLKRVRFWIEKNNALVFQLNIFRHARFWKIVCIQKITFWFFLIRQNDIFFFPRAFLKSIILFRNFLCLSDFDLKKNTTRQVLTWKKIQRVRFWKKKFRLVRFWIKHFSSFSILGSNLVPPHVLFTSFSSI